MPTAELNKVAAHILLDITLGSLVLVISVTVFLVLSVTKLNGKVM